MTVFQSQPRNPPSSLNRLVRKHPSLFGVPFLLIMVGASYGLTIFTQTRYDLHDKKVKNVRISIALITLKLLTLSSVSIQVTKEQELNLNQNRKKFDIREEYFVRDTL